MEDKNKFLTEEEVDQKVAELKERFEKYKSEQVRVIYGSINQNKQAQNKKEKNRRRSKLQKISRKRNR